MPTRVTFRDAIRGMLWATKLTSEDTMAAHAERLQENAQQLKQNRDYCEHMDRVESANLKDGTR